MTNKRKPGRPRKVDQEAKQQEEIKQEESKAIKTAEDFLKDDFNSKLTEEDKIEIDVNEDDKEESIQDAIKSLTEENEQEQEEQENEENEQEQKEQEKQKEEFKIQESLGQIEQKQTTTKSYQTRKRNQLDRDMLVPVVSFFVGTVFYKSDRTGAIYKFREFGVVDDIELFELQAMRRAYPKFLTEPWLIILDDEVVEYLGLSDLYEKLLKPDKLNLLFKARPSKIRKILENAPRGMKRVVAGKAKQMADAGKFDSVQKRKVIEETCNVDLSI